MSSENFSAVYHSSDDPRQMSTVETDEQRRRGVSCGGHNQVASVSRRRYDALSQRSTHHASLELFLEELVRAASAFGPPFLLRRAQLDAADLPRDRFRQIAEFEP